MSSNRRIRKRAVSESTFKLPDAYSKERVKKTSWHGDIKTEELEDFYGYGYKCSCVPSTSSTSVDSMIYEGKTCNCGNTKVYNTIDNSFETKWNLSTEQSQNSLNRDTISTWTPYSDRCYTHTYQRRQLQAVPVQQRPLPPLPPIRSNMVG